MGFLSNDSDILCDMVLTDEGRARLAKGDGSFKIVKFAVADDEIDYSFFDGTNASGSAYYDLNLLLTPVFEAFTDNNASMKHKCLSISRTNLLYLPILKMNTLVGTDYTTNNTFYVAVDQNTETVLTDGGLNPIYGYSLAGGFHIKVDQGLDSQSPDYTTVIDPELKETQYIIEIDSRFGSVASFQNMSEVPPAYIDDDKIASYYLNLQDTNFVKDIPGATTSANISPLSGPRGTTLDFKIKSTMELSTSDYLFDTIGRTDGTYKYIDTIVRIYGATTGAMINVPVTYVKKI